MTDQPQTPADDQNLGQTPTLTPEEQEMQFMQTSAEMANMIAECPERTVVKLWGDCLLDAKRMKLDVTRDRYSLTPHDLSVALMLAQVPGHAALPIIAAIKRIVALKADGKLNDGGFKLITPGPNNGPLIA